MIQLKVTNSNFPVIKLKENNTIMKNLFFIGILVFSKYTNAQELKFDVKAYTENSKKGFHEEDEIINSSNGQFQICDRKYTANLKEKKLYFY